MRTGDVGGHPDPRPGYAPIGERNNRDMLTFQKQE